MSKTPQLYIFSVRYLQPSVFSLITSDRASVRGPAARSSREPWQVSMSKHDVALNHPNDQPRLSVHAILAFGNKVSRLFWLAEVQFMSSLYSVWLQMDEIQLQDTHLKRSIWPFAFILDSRIHWNLSPQNPSSKALQQQQQKWKTMCHYLIKFERSSV